MLDQYLTESQLLRQIRKSDFWKMGNFQESQADIKAVARKAHEKFHKGYIPEFSFFNQSGKDIASANSITDSLILRKLAHDISRCYGTKQSPRNIIMGQVISLLKESIPVSIFRVDLKNFYESIPIENIMHKLNIDGRVIKKTISIIKAIYGERGFMFRGLPTSAALSDIYLKDFDRMIKSNRSVYYYARFVDDMILFSFKENQVFLSDLVSKNLPFGLKINGQKTCFVGINNDNGHSTVNYLGYSIDIKSYKKESRKRDIIVSIDDKKLSKIKTRIVLSLKDFSKNRNSELLVKRLKFLSGNCRISSRKFNSYLMTGIKYNYPLLTSTECIKSLDSFFRKCIFPKNNTFCINREGVTFWGKLKKISFLAGYKESFVHRFDRISLYEIKKCWKYV